EQEQAVCSEAHLSVMSLALLRCAKSLLHCSTASSFDPARPAFARLVPGHPRSLPPLPAPESSPGVVRQPRRELEAALMPMAIQGVERAGRLNVSYSPIA